MNQDTEGKRFRQDLFPAELEEIRRRRREAGDDRVLPEDAGDFGPSADLDLIGLAFSGGGIRSASFSLGVAQYLIQTGQFKHVDYLSTVSGGGYTGSCLSALMAHGHGGEQLLVHRDGPEEPPALNHLRNCSNFLVPSGLFNSVRMPSLFMIGILQTLLLFVPIVILLVFLTEVFFELTGWLSLPVPSFMIAIVGVTPLLAAVFVRPLVQSRRRNWEQRDRADRRAGVCLLLAVASLSAMPVLGALEFLVQNDILTVLETIRAWVQGHVEIGFRSWLFWLVAVISFALIGGLFRFGTSLLLWVCGALGPLSLLAAYMLCCIYVINSPHVNRKTGADYLAALEAYVASGDSKGVGGAVAKILGRKQFRSENYEIAFDSINRIDVAATKLNVHRLPEAEDDLLARSAVLRWLTTRQEDVLTIRIDANRGHAVWIGELSVLRLRTEWIVYSSAFLLWLFNYLFVNVNRTSLHPFYRDRLSRSFLIHGRDNVIELADSLRLSELGSEHSTAPYHLVNAALNLQGSRDPQLRQRKTVPFLLSKRFCGSEYTGYCETQQMEKVDRNMDLGTAMAISAAAAGPMMGAKTMRSLAFFMAMLNIRLAYWLPHPDRVERFTWLNWFIHRNPGLSSLLSEACGTVSDRGRFVNCSDGGHIENLGVYELLKRRCRTIICVDGGGDPKFEFFDLITLQRYANIDLDARIEIDPTPIFSSKSVISKEHFAIGSITYRDGTEGTMIYMKLSYTGDEPEYVRFYKRKVTAFPHESTADQFFDETKFEVYRALGYHVARSTLTESTVRDHLKSRGVSGGTVDPSVP